MPHSSEFFALQAALAGRYTLCCEIGRGGMGVVFEARDVSLDRPVAIKLLPPSLAGTDEARESFVQEARTAASLQHPHVVPIHAVEERDGLVYFVMALVDGESLGDRVRRAGPLPPREAVKVIQEVAWALCHAHGRAVVHRDVKPDNILIDRDSGRAVVTDFGIAQCMTCAAPTAGVAMGTPAYMSPELARGGIAGVQSDLYALGVTAWVAATGHPPYPGPTAAAFMTQHAASPVPSLHDAAPELPVTFTAAIDRCLAKAPADRWDSAEALARALEAGRARMPVVAAPVRAFLREWDRVGAEVATAGTASAVSGTLAAAVMVFAGNGIDRTILGWIYIIIAGLTGTLALTRLGQLSAHARLLRASGIDHARIGEAQRIEATERREERRSELHARPERGAMAGVAVAEFGLTGFALWGLFKNIPGPIVVLLSSLTVVLPTVGIRALWRHWTRDRDEGTWSRLARGRLGRAIFRLAGVGLHAPEPTRLSRASEPTLALVGAQARLAWEGLSPDRRAALADVPAIIDRLELEAQSAAAADTRDANARVTQAVAAVELLRLDMLRLATSPSEGSGLTEAIEQARQVGRVVDAVTQVGS